ncbi:hypothetical protein M9H77_11224 [Catharanthus roseus]|uniref:Uncharacterized protein n=1 Tax=Catharanthus roseus TaxID=4058 RepID=A0ACC0BE08_CATRO|nr:hypothetical protein M9H77_11224 [Catharanthus roseus]
MGKRNNDESEYIFVYHLIFGIKNSRSSTVCYIELRAWSVQTIYNVLAKMKKRMQGRNTVDEVFYLSARRGYMFTICILLLRYNMPLLKAIGMTPTGKNFTIVTAFMRNEQATTCRWVLEQIKHFQQNKGSIFEVSRLHSWKQKISVIKGAVRFFLFQNRPSYFKKGLFRFSFYKKIGRLFSKTGRPFLVFYCKNVTVTQTVTATFSLSYIYQFLTGGLGLGAHKESTSQIGEVEIPTLPLSELEH